MRFDPRIDMRRYNTICVFVTSQFIKYVEMLTIRYNREKTSPYDVIRE
jgi:hypothetical protein